MEFKIHQKKRPAQRQYNKDDLGIAYDFAKKLHRELKDILKAIVLFGASARNNPHSGGDIDVLVVIDDVTIVLTPEVTEAYRIITEKLVVSTSKKLHITTMRLTSFWEYVKVGDPVAINMLRDGVPLLDSGFFEPMQLLLYQGRIRPTVESIWTYFSKAPQSLSNAKWHILQGVIDLYWSVIDSAHAALMKLGEQPPSPQHVADLIEERMVKTKIIHKKYATTMRNFFKISKMILHREVKEISGEEFDRYYVEAHDFVKVMQTFIQKK
ncbi:MAG: nucleotidyltransferase domain-containing protein [archaeon]